MQYDDIENTQDANSEESSAPQNDTSDGEVNQSSAPESEETRQASQPDQKPVPFNEDPRIRDYIERQVSKATQTYQQQMADLQRQFQEQAKARQAPSKQEHPFVAKINEIDPVYAEYFKGLEQKTAEIEEFKQWKKEQERQSIVREYESSVERLHAENKVPKELQAIYRRQLDAMAMSNPNLGLRDLPEVYKSVHDEMSKLMEGIKRSERASYVSAKTKDGFTPPPSKGKAAAPKGASEFTGDRETDLALIAKRALKLSKAESDI